MNTLALDIATKTGWSVWRAGAQEKPKPSSSGAETFGQQPRAASFCAFSSWLETKLQQEKIKGVIAEAPIPMHRRSTFSVARKLLGFAAIAESLCHAFGVAYTEVSIRDWRQHFMGASRAPAGLSASRRRKFLKDAAIAECKKRGWKVASDDEADALGIGSYAQAQGI